jgi:hypothetical protein
MTTQYTVTIRNQAASSNYLMMFQNDPGSWSPNSLPLAWFSKFSNPNSTVKFNWTVDWGLSWSETGTLQPGVTYDASELWLPTDGNNKTILDYNGSYLFGADSAGPDPNRLYLQESKNIPVNSDCAVGVTMSGSTVYATQALPNTNLTFSPHPSYYLAYGNYEQGEVLDISSINNPLKLNYPTGVYSLTVTLNADNTWAVQTLAQANVVRLASMAKQ